MPGIAPFLTAYDPSDAPAGSIDPLGFFVGYQWLADKILPGMTNVASCPRYFGLLCAGSFLAPVDAEAPPRAQRDVRQKAILRLERFWALTHALAFEDQPETELSGLRGVTYAQRYLSELHENGAVRTDADFLLLSRQAAYGVIGIYANVAENCRALYRKTYELTPGLGEPLAEVFLSETAVPNSLRRAVAQGEEVSISLLKEWGQAAYLWGRTKGGEARCLRDMFHSDGTRSRFGQHLTECPARDGEAELTRLARVAQRLRADPKSHDLWEATKAILHYESCYRRVLLAFERLLYRCRSDPSGAVHTDDLQSDEVLRAVCDGLPKAVNELAQHVDAAGTPAFRDGLSRIDNVRQFLAQAAAASDDLRHLVEVLLQRHAEVQHGKFDQGRRKMPWIQQTDGRLSLTLMRVGGMTGEPRCTDDIAAHPYRLLAADNWLKAGGER